MHIRNWMALGHDVAAAMIAWYLAYWLRFNTDIPQFNVPNMVGSMLWVVPLQALVFDCHYDQYRGVVCLVRIMNGTIKAGARTRA